MAILAKFLFMPTGVRRQVVSGLSKFWDGPVHVDRVEFNYSKPVYLRGITLNDKERRNWIKIGTIKATLGDWRRGSPKVKEIEIEKLKLQLYLAGGKLPIPIRSSGKETPTPETDLFDLEKLTIRDCSIVIADSESATTIYDNLLLTASRNQQVYDVVVTTSRSGDSGVLSIKGVIDARTFETEMSLEVRRKFDKADTAMLLAGTNVLPGYQAEGRLSGNAKITGTIMRPASLRPMGTAKLEDWVVWRRDRAIAQDFNASIKLNGRDIAFENLTGVFCQGRIQGSLYTNMENPESVEFGGQFSAKGVDLFQLTDSLGTSRKFKTGTGSASYSFTGGKSLQSLRGGGLIILDDTDVGALPVVTHIFQVIGLGRLDRLQKSDAAVAFTMSGPEVTLGQARLANRLGAIEAEPGGTVNLQSGQLDFYVVAIPLTEINELIARVPLVGLFAKLKDKLTRLHIKGHWSDQPGKLIKKEPIKDIQEGTVDFLQGAAKSAGQLTTYTLEVFKNLFETFGKQKRE